MPKHKYPHPRKFWAKGTIYTRLDIAGAMPVHTERAWGLGPAQWFRTDDQELFEHLSKQRARDIAYLRKTNREFWKDIPSAEQARVCDPYIRGQGGFMSSDHMEVFVSASARIT